MSPSSSSLITMQNLVVVSHTFGAHVKDLKNFVESESLDGAMVLDETCSSPCYYTNFLWSRSTTWVQVWVPKMGDTGTLPPWDGERG